MKFTYQIIILFLLFIYVTSDQCNKFSGIPTNENDCFNQLSEEQMNDLKKTHCCFFESDDQVDPKCIALTQAQFDKIDDYIEYNEILWGYVNLRINCKSNHFKIAMFNLLLFALFI